jgi:hypothetical protein
VIETHEQVAISKSGSDHGLRFRAKQKPPRGETWRLFDELINSNRLCASFYRL